MQWRAACATLLSSPDCAYTSYTACIAAVDAADNNEALCAGKAETVSSDYCEAIPVVACDQCGQFAGNYCGVISLGSVYQQSIEVNVASGEGGDCEYEVTIPFFAFSSSGTDTLVTQTCGFDELLLAGDIGLGTEATGRLASDPSSSRLVIISPIYGIYVSTELTKDGCSSTYP